MPDDGDGFRRGLLEVLQGKKSDVHRRRSLYIRMPAPPEIHGHGSSRLDADDSGRRKIVEKAAEGIRRIRCRHRKALRRHVRPDRGDGPHVLPAAGRLSPQDRKHRHRHPRRLLQHPGRRPRRADQAQRNRRAVLRRPQRISGLCALRRRPPIRRRTARPPVYRRHRLLR